MEKVCKLSRVNVLVIGHYFEKFSQKKKNLVSILNHTTPLIQEGQTLASLKEAIQSSVEGLVPHSAEKSNFSTEKKWQMNNQMNRGLDELSA
jgi:hypothetical protein